MLVEVEALVIWMRAGMEWHLHLSHGRRSFSVDSFFYVHIMTGILILLLLSFSVLRQTHLAFTSGLSRTEVLHMGGDGLPRFGLEALCIISADAGSQEERKDVDKCAVDVWYAVSLGMKKRWIRWQRLVNVSENTMMEFGSQDFLERDHLVIDMICEFRDNQNLMIEVNCPSIDNIQQVWYNIVVERLDITSHRSGIASLNADLGDWNLILWNEFCK